MKIHLLSLFALLLTVTQGAWAQDELGGEFSVSAVKKVHFSRGNLRATTSDLGKNWTWTFAEHQWDYVGNAAANTKINGNKSVSDNGTVDLFGFSTETTYYGIHNSGDNGTFSDAFKDWGEIIGTGWYTPSQDEWTYLLNTRSGSTVGATANARYTYATINTDATGVRGLMLFPDGVTFAASEATSWGTINGKSAWNSATRCSAAQWTALEAKGCVFLPAAGNRNGTTINNAGASGYYRTSTVYDNNSAYRRLFGEDNDSDPYGGRFRGYAVRLVKEITYNVASGATMSEGWTIDPAGPVAEGVEVTATYSGSRHVKSVTYRPAGTIGGKFTINGSGDKVYFSKGNLQLVGENRWKFADNQWETFGENQSDNHRDLFGWCTVATPNKTSEDDEDYTSDTDWGDDPYLQACIGTGWHLITGGNSGKWNYLLNSRTTTSGIRYAVGNVNGKNGLILLPDDWNAEYYALNNTNKDNGHYDNNNISLSDWTEKLEAHGAVFLPAGGHRIGTDLYVVNAIGHYWCSTRQANGDVMRIDEGLILPNWTLNFNYGCSIRLVRDVAE